MQSYNLVLSPQQSYSAIQATGDLFVYESGVTAPDGGERRIVVKPDADAEIILRPGQRFRLAPGDRASAWAVRTLDPTVSLTGSIIIGAGEFDDANTLNTFKLDGTFSNTVSISNDAAHAVPVAIQTPNGARVPVALDPSQFVNASSSNIMAYTNSYAAAGAPSAVNTAIKMLDPALNLNGAILNKFDNIVSRGAMTLMRYAVIAKATAPANITDGDVLFSGFFNGSGVQRVSMDVGKDGQPRIVAGKGIWFISDVADESVMRTALFTVQ
jgi:hypothetical protein